MNILRTGVLLFALTLTFNLYARFAAVTYDGVRYFINVDQRWAAVDVPFASWEKYSGNVKVRAKVWENGVPNVAYPVTKILSSAFSDSPDLLSVELPSTITVIQSRAFYRCPKLAKVNIPEGVATIGDDAFRETNVSATSLPSTLKVIGDRAFYESGTGDIIIPSGVTEIGEQAFYNSYSIERLYFEATNCNKQIGYGAFPKRIKKLIFSDDVKVIPDHAFEYCKNNHIYTRIGGKDIIGKLPSSLEYLGLYAFRGCENLKEIDTGTSKITSISEYAFSSCSDLRYVNLPNIKAIEGGAFVNCDNIALLVLGENLSQIDKESFSYGNVSNVLKTIWTSSDPISTGEYVYSKINIVPNEKYNFVRQYIYPNLKQRFSKNGVIFVPSNASKKFADIIGCTFEESVIDIDISEPNVEYNGILFKINKILPYSFAGNLNLEKAAITIPLELAPGLFLNCNNLSNVTIPSKTELIPYDIFKNTALAEVRLPEFVKEISLRAFYGCGALREIVFGDKIERIGESAFENCSNLIDIKLPESVSSIQYRAFSNCTKMQTFEGLGNLRIIGSETFDNCNNLVNVSLGHNVYSIGSDIFRGCNKIEELNTYAAEPPKVSSSTFSDIDKWHCTLHVPLSSLEKYTESEGWKDFLIINNDLEDISSAIADILIEQDVVIKIYSLNGYLIFEGSLTELDCKIENIKAGIYIMRIGDIAKKIRVR